ncbi:restriction endonuclease subunit S [Noviherbaspirillum sp. 1P10PC]|uniref:restriction endonuclease subunit S n=1 Tax=Noviherbaspirillum sp. 1P10PC TaxID=3132292 RepID=UPI0039A24E6C
MRFKPYSKYKKSGIEWLGEVPAHWKIRKIKWLFQIQKRIAGTLGYDVLSITQQGIKVKDTESGDGQLSMDYSKYQFVEIGDFAMNHMDLLTGYVDISKFHGVTSPDYRVFTARDLTICFKQYFLYLFQIAYKNKIFYPFGQGSSHLGRWRLPTDQFNAFLLPLPEVEEQIAISAFLDRETAKIDTLISKQEKLIELLKEKRQAVILRAVTKGTNPTVPMKPSGVDWIGDVPAHWEIRSIKSILCERIEKNDPVKTTFILSLTMEQGVIPYSERSGGGNKAKEDLTAYKLAYPNDIVINSMNVVAGSAGLSKFFGAVSPVYYMLFPRQKEDKVEYFSNIFQCQSFQRSLLGLGNGIMMKEAESSGKLNTIRMRIPMGKLSAQVVPYPSSQEQESIVHYIDSELNKIDVLIAKSEQAIRLQMEHRSALINAVVTGKINVMEAITDLQQAA